MIRITVKSGFFLFKTPVRDERNYDKNCFDDQVARTTEGIKDPEGEGGAIRVFIVKNED